MPPNSRAQLALDFLTRLRAGDRAGAGELVTVDARHHNPYFPAGMSNLIAAAVGAAASAPDRTSTVQRVVDGGDVVAVHSHVQHRPGDLGVSVVHIFRFDGDKIVELWDVGQPVPADNKNADGMF